MPGSKPHLTGTQHILHFNSLDPKQFERLSLWLIQREGFEDAEHLGAAGSEQGRDLIAWRAGELWAFQCKQVQSFTAATAIREVDKLLELPVDQIPRHYVFIASCQISAEARLKIRQMFGDRLDLHFWAVTELDEKIKKYPDIQHEFFQDVTPLPSSLHSIPPPPADFIGRDQQLAELQQAHAGGIHIVGTRGLGGIGKSALAFALAEKLSTHYPDGQIMLDMLGTGQQPLSPPDAMRKVIRIWYPQAKLPESQSELHDLYLSVLHDKKIILLLDNARDRLQVEPLIPPKTCLLLVTSRFHFTLPGLKSCDLEALNPADAIALLLSIAPRLELPSPQVAADSIRPEPGMRVSPAATLASLCECLPLALRLSASALADQPTLPVAEFLQKFQQTQSRLRLTGMDTSLQVSYDLLSEDLQPKLRCLSVFPAPFDRPAAAAIWDVDQDTAQPSLDSLVNASLLDFTETTGFSLHDLVRDFASNLLNPAESYTASFRHSAHYLEVARQANDVFLQGGENQLAGLRLFDLHWPHLRLGQRWTAAQPETDQPAARLCVQYPDAARYCLTLRLHPEQQIAWLQAALAAARRLEWKEAQCAHLGNLGLAYAALGQVDQAIEYYQKALVIAREIGDRRNEGAWLGNLGNAYRDLGQVDKAIEYHQQALVIAREIGDRRGEGNRLGNLGLAYSALGQVDQAIEYHQKALAISREIGDRRMEGNALGNLGNAYSDLGQVDQAIEYYQQALVIAREIGDRRGEGNHLGNLGLAYRNLGQVDQAIEYHQQALVISREIGDRRGEGADLGSLGLAYSALGQVDKAIEYYQQALVIAGEIGDRRGEGYNLGYLASAYENQDELARAVPLAAAALAILTEIKSPYKDWASNILSRLREKMGDAAFHAALSAPADP